MTIIRINMPPANVCRIRMKTLVYMSKQGRHSYILVGENQTHRYYLSLATGSIELEKHAKGSEFVKRQLVPYWKCDLRHVADIYWNSTLIKSDPAIQVLDEIRLSGPDRLNFLELVPAEKVKPTKAERVKRKANQVSLEKICQELGVSTSRVRAAFRRVDFQKPGARWAWGKSQAALVKAKIKELLKK